MLIQCLLRCTFVNAVLSLEVFYSFCYKIIKYETRMFVVPTTVIVSKPVLFHDWDVLVYLDNCYKTVCLHQSSVMAPSRCIIRLPNYHMSKMSGCSNVFFLRKSIVFHYSCPLPLFVLFINWVVHVHSFYFRNSSRTLRTWICSTMMLHVLMTTERKYSKWFPVWNIWMGKLL